MTSTDEQADRHALAKLVRQHLGDGAPAFELKILSDGSRRIKGPYASACYPAASWVVRFCDHLELGYFVRPARAPTVARQPAPASGGTGP